MTIPSANIISEVRELLLSENAQEQRQALLNLDAQADALGLDGITECFGLSGVTEPTPAYERMCELGFNEDVFFLVLSLLLEQGSPWVRRIQTLEVTASTLVTLDGLPPLPNLNRLVLLDAHALVTIEGLKCCSSLQEIELAHATSLQTLEGIGELQGLKTVNLEGCKALKSLAPLAECPQLETVNAQGCLSLEEDPEQVLSLHGLVVLEKLRRLVHPTDTESIYLLFQKVQVVPRYLTTPYLGERRSFIDASTIRAFRSVEGARAHDSPDHEIVTVTWEQARSDDVDITSDGSGAELKVHILLGRPWISDYESDDEIGYHEGPARDGEPGDKLRELIAPVFIDYRLACRAQAQHSYRRFWDVGQNDNSGFDDEYAVFDSFCSHHQVNEVFSELGLSADSDDVYRYIIGIHPETFVELHTVALEE